MPKQTYKIEQFHGGINSDSDPRDLREGQSPSLIDCDISSPGRIKLIGKVDNGTIFSSGTAQAQTGTPATTSIRLRAASSGSDDYYNGYSIIITGGTNVGEVRTISDYDATGHANGTRTAIVSVAFTSASDETSVYEIVGDANTTSILKNKGLFVMSSDRQLDAGSADETLIFSLDNANNTIDIKDSEGWDNAQITPSGSIDPLYYSADGVIRVADKNLTRNTRWFGYITDERFASINAASGVPGWYDTDQEVAKPTTGKCLISTPHAGGDTNGVNSDGLEYIGDVIDNSGTDVAVHSAVNLRVGVQTIDLFPNTASVMTGLNSNLADNTDLYPIFGDNNILASDDGSNGTSSQVNDSVDDFSVTEEQSVVFGFFISSAELAKLKEVHLTMSSFEWSFTADQLIADCWNLLVCGANNVSVLASGGLGSTMTAWVLVANQKSTESGNVRPTFYLSGPVLCSNGGALGVDAFQPGSYTFHHTYLYDDARQESLPFLFDDVDTGSAPNNRNELNIVGSPLLLNFDAYICSNVGAGNAYGFNKRLVGSRIYWKAEENDNYFLVGELDFVDKGFKWTPEADVLAYDMANTSDTTAPILSKTAILKGINPVSANIVDTFKVINGFSSEVTSLEAKYKTAVVHGRRTYVGNIKQDDKTHPDRVLKSQVNKFDTFPKGHGVIDVVIRDGEDIVKLEAYADRILQFKKNSLYIINISDNIEFLEDTYRNKGCSFDYHVTKTDIGISWFNIHGVYLYDGKQLHNLLEQGGIRIINEADWEAFITDGEDGSSDDSDMSSAQIGYIPKRRQILINNENNDVFLYDFVLKAWTKGDSRITEDSNMSNFALDADQDLFYIDNTTTVIKTWQTSAQSSVGFLYKTPDIDFGEPAVRKKIYKVYVTYKSGNNATNVIVDYDVNGGTSFGYDFEDGTNFASAELAAANGWQVAELKPDTSSEANNVKSFQLRFQVQSSQIVPADFEINDISIIYRMKHIK